MASKGKINDIIDFPAIEVQKKQLLGAIDEIIARMEKVSKYAASIGIEFKGANKISEVAAATEKLGEANKELSEILAKKAVVDQKIDSLRNGEAKALAEATEQLKKRRQEVALNAKIDEAQPGSIAKSRAELSKLKKEWAETGDAAKRNELGQSISALNAEILEAEKSIGVFGRQVGNYEIAGKSLRGELRQLTEEIARMKLAGEDSGEAYDTMVRKVGEMKDAMDDAGNEIKKFASDTGKLDQYISVFEGLAGGVSAFQGGMALLGVENEDIEKTFVKLQAAMTLVNGLKAIQNTLQKESAAYTLAENIQAKIKLTVTNLQNTAEKGGIITRKLATAAQWALNAAMKANPVGLLIGGIVALAAAAYGLFKLFSSGTDTTKQYNAAIDQSKTSVESLNKELDRNVKFMEAQGASQLSIINEKKKAAQQEFDIQSNLVEKLQSLGSKKTDDQKQQLQDAITAQEEAWAKIVALNDDAVVLDFKQRQEASKLKIENMKDGFNKEMALINFDYDEKIKNAEGNNELIDQLEIQRGIKKNEIIKKYNESALKSERETNNEFITELKKTITDATNSVKESGAIFDNEADKKAWEDIQKEALKYMQIMDAIRTGKPITEAPIEPGTPEMKDSGDGGLEELIQRTDEEIALAEMKKEKLIELSQQTFDTINAMVQASFERRFQALDEEAAKFEEAKERELQAAGDNDAKRQAIEAKYASKLEAIEKQKKALKIKQFKAEKNAAIIQANMDIGLSILKTAATMGYPAAIPFIIAAGVLGAIQLAMIASQPIPQYFKGREDGPAELAIVGERGSEGIELPGGKSYLTPSRPTLTFLPEHARVIPHEELLQAAGAMAMTPISHLPESYGLDYRELKNEIAGLKTGLDKVVKAINDKQELHINITERGLQAAAQRGANFTRYLNQNVRL